MPKARRSRVSATHEPSAKIHKRMFALQDNVVEHVEIGGAAEVSGNEILASLDSIEEPQESLTKKEKQQIKRDAFLQKLGAFKPPQSKSHTRREKRKAKEQLAGGGLNDIQTILSTIANNTLEVEDAKSSNNGEKKSSDDMETDESRRVKVKPQVKIGEGKSEPLTKNQRKKVLQMEQFRQPLIRSNPEFSKNPFQTIRTHAQNTLLKHQVPST